jgi:hypothetical protein
MVEQSIRREPGANPSASPPGPKRTSPTCGESVTQVTTTSLARATSAGVSTSCAPSALSSSARPGVRFQTVRLNPARARLAAMAAPIVPSPTKPTLLLVGASVFVSVKIVSFRGYCSSLQLWSRCRSLCSGGCRPEPYPSAMQRQMKLVFSEGINENQAEGASPDSAVTLRH